MLTALLSRPLLPKISLVLIASGFIAGFIAIAGHPDLMHTEPESRTVYMFRTSGACIVTALTLASMHYAAPARARLHSFAIAAAAAALCLVLYLNFVPTIRWTPESGRPVLPLGLGWPWPAGGVFCEKTAGNTFQPDWSQSGVFWPLIIVDFATALCLVLAAATIANAVSARLSSKKRTARTGLPGPEKT